MSEVVHINQIVSRAMIQFGLSSPEVMLRFQVYCEEGARSLNCLSTYTEQYETITLVDNKAKLPCGFYKLLGARPLDANGCYCNNLTYVDYVFANNCTTTLNTSILFPCCCNYDSLFKIINGYLHFHTPNDITQIQMAWMGLNTDDQGLMVIDKRYERALYNYTAWQYAMSPGSNVPRDDKYEFHNGWVEQKDMLIGEDQVKQWNLEKEWIGITLLNRVKISPRI